MRVVPIFIAAAILTSPLAAETVTPPARYTTTTVFGNDACPTPNGDEIVVCARMPESDRYRIPKALRKKKRVDSGPSASWASRRMARLCRVSAAACSARKIGNLSYLTFLQRFCIQRGNGNRHRLDVFTGTACGNDDVGKAARRFVCLLCAILRVRSASHRKRGNRCNGCKQNTIIC